MVIKTINKFQKYTTGDIKCVNCIYSRLARNDNVVGCILLHNGTIKPEDIKGFIWEGWYGKGMLINGLVVQKDSYCNNFKRINNKEMIKNG